MDMLIGSTRANDRRGGWIRVKQTSATTTHVKNEYRPRYATPKQCPKKRTPSVGNLVYVLMQSLRSDKFRAQGSGWLSSPLAARLPPALFILKSERVTTFHNQPDELNDKEDTY